MPKPGKFNNKPSWKAQYSDHDFRGSNEPPRRVSFKSNRGFKKNKDWTTSIRAHLQDEDVDMGTSTSDGRTFRRFKGGKRGGRSDSPVPGRQRLLDGPMGWFKIILPYGNTYEKDFILRTLAEKVKPCVFWPIMWKTNGNCVTFYLDDFQTAGKLNELNRQIQMPDGFRMLIKVHNGCPNIDINPQLKEKIKLTMAKRYNSQTKALDLTAFHADPDLQDTFCALFKPPIFLTVLEIISDNISEIEAINFFNNKISHFSYLKKVQEKLPHLKILHLGSNKLRDIYMLDPLIGLPIIDLVLDGNPLCAKFKDHDVYVGEVRKKFPKVMKLDGIDLPPPISFDIVEETKLPIKCQTFLCDPNGENVVREFLKQYFLIYDQDNNGRSQLLQAYHENAVFSLTTCYPYGQNKDRNTNWLNWYMSENRNITRLYDPERRLKLLKQGNSEIVAFLHEMPLTKHDMNSFTVDLVLYTSQMLVLSITGLFKELKSGHKKPPIRSFFKTLIIVPVGQGFCIINDALHVTNATDEQVKNSFNLNTPAITPPSTPVVSTSTPDDATKQQMVLTLSQQTGMNLEWSEKCLAETHWDFQRAFAVFAEFQQKRIIPPEAFVK